MDRLKDRLETAQRALKKLHKLAVKIEINEIGRNALIQRFKVTFEIM